MSKVVERVTFPEPPDIVWRAATRVSFTLEPTGSATALTLEHTGFTGLGGFILSRMHRGGWAGKFLRRQLPRVLARVANHRARHEIAQ